jgi:hypothetical protein
MSKTFKSESVLGRRNSTKVAAKIGFRTLAPSLVLRRAH